MTDSQGGAVAAGWYSDPMGQAGVRWWDGTQWTSYTAPTPTGQAVSPAGPRPRIPDTTPIYTPFIWIYVLLPLVPTIAILFYQPRLPVLSDASTDPLRYQQETYAAVLTPAYFAILALGLLTLVATVLMAYLDHRALVRAGVVRPFSWAWAFFTLISLGVLVYPIGRSIIARQVARPRGLAPIWVLVGVVVLQLVIAIVWTVMLMNQVVAQLPTYR